MHNHGQLRQPKLMSLSKDSIFTQQDYHVWCGSTIRATNGRYLLFYSRWPRDLGFNAWLTHSEIACAESTSPFGPFKFKDAVLPERGPGFWDGHNTHNVTIMCFKKRYYLYYTGNRGEREKTSEDCLAWSHRNNQRIGVAIADKLEGPWERFDEPVIDIAHDKDHPHALAVANPTVIQRPDQTYLMIFKAIGRKDRLPFGGPVCHLAAIAEKPNGPFKTIPKPLFPEIKGRFPTEDPFLFYYNQQYHLLLKDMQTYLSKFPQALIHMQSQNGIDWNLSNLNVFNDRRVNIDGKIVEFEKLERPQIYFENNAPLVFNAATLLAGDTACLSIPIDSTYLQSKLAPMS